MHLIETVEEMKKLNARRRLKGAVMAALASPKWCLDPSDPDNFSETPDDDVTSQGYTRIPLHTQFSGLHLFFKEVFSSPFCLLFQIFNIILYNFYKSLLLQSLLL